jgi:hypothetical protein
MLHSTLTLIKSETDPTNSRHRLWHLLGMIHSCVDVYGNFSVNFRRHTVQLANIPLSNDVGRRGGVEESGALDLIHFLFTESTEKERYREGKGTER